MVRFFFFVLFFIAIAVWEVVIPFKSDFAFRARQERWLNHFGLIAITQFVLKILVPVSLVGIAEWCYQKEIGLSYLSTDWSIGIPIIQFLVLDFVIYWQHRIFHDIPFLWKFHRMHHTERYLDLTSALRFHPVEMIISFFIKAIFIVLFGIYPAIVILFEILLNGLAMFNHANLNIPEEIDTLLRKFIVTPDMHRVHHSSKSEDIHHNYGFNLSIWDYLLKTYKKISKNDLENFSIGLPLSEKQGNRSIVDLLKDPFV
ncbi:MAG: sterol desaturase family protein [Halobacteriovoraceae bacterium]|nr:sterol desaturase family protein [Halobacteriovoraceae bacterium]